MASGNADGFDVQGGRGDEISNDLYTRPNATRRADFYELFVEETFEFGAVAAHVGLQQTHLACDN